MRVLIFGSVLRLLPCDNKPQAILPVIRTVAHRVNPRGAGCVFDGHHPHDKRRSVKVYLTNPKLKLLLRSLDTTSARELIKLLLYCEYDGPLRQRSFSQPLAKLVLVWWLYNVVYTHSYISIA